MIAASRAVRIEPALFTATKTNQMLEDISSQMLGGKVTLDLDLDVVKMTFEAEMRSARTVRPLQDFVAPFLRLIYANGTEVLEQVGLFVLLPPIGHHYPSASMYELQGVDFCWLLEANQTPVTVNDSTNSTPVGQAKSALSSVGLSRQAIPRDSTNYSKAVSWGPGTSRLRRINDRFVTAGYYSLWFDRHGVATSRPYDDLATTQPAVTYTSAAGSQIVPPIDDTPDISRICNRVIVLGTDPAAAPIVSIRENNDPTSPVSYQNMGGWIARTIEDPNIQTQAAADAMAENILREGASFYRTLQLQTVPDPTRNPREVYALNVYDQSSNQLVDGKWRCSGWELSLDWSNPVMVHQLGREEAFQVTAV